MYIDIDSGTLLHIEIRKETEKGEEVWVWTSSPISRSSNLVIEIPIEAAAAMEITEGDYLHIRIQKDDAMQLQCHFIMHYIGNSGIMELFIASDEVKEMNISGFFNHILSRTLDLTIYKSGIRELAIASMMSHDLIDELIKYLGINGDDTTEAMETFVM